MKTIKFSDGNRYKSVSGLADSSSPRSNIMKVLKKMYDIGKLIYGEERIDIVEANLGTSMRYKFIIHFPEIVIRNSKDESHTIRDLYVLFTFIVNNDKNEITMPCSMQGTRTTYSKREALHQYKHSHLMSGFIQGGVVEDESFCLGESTMYLLISDLSLKISRKSPSFLLTEQAEEIWDIFSLMLIEVDAYVKWESIEGVPYMRFSHIYTSNSPRHSNSNPSAGERLRVFTEISNFIASGNLVLKINDRIPFIMPIIENMNEINEVAMRITSLRSTVMPDGSIINGIVLSSNDGTIHTPINIRSASSMLFKGKVIEPTLIQEENKEDESEIKNKVICHVSILNYVFKRILSNHFAVKCNLWLKEASEKLRAEELKRRRETVAVRESIIENLLPVSES